YIAKVDVTANNTTEILDFFKKCPYFLNGLITSGKHNLCVFLMSEDISTLDAIVDGHIRSNPQVKDVDFNIVITPTEDLIFPVEMAVEKTREPPCGYKGSCGECAYYKSDRCLGCPATGFFKGSFW
ncbi:MAG: Lrp/AsnC ligand binding domain-containing protein, partial [Euryarchaeota archaeon]|nr:Lrp/AsnC ligand binding domain-containing protein [Euryarchaeota archaeon]